MTKKRDALLDIVKGKDVLLCTHWDADGVTSAALIFHLIKNHAKSIETFSKGMPFIIEPDDIKDNYDVIICTDITASTGLKELAKVVYIDHHPTSNAEFFDLTIHDPDVQSCSLLIWQELLPDTNNPYFIFLSLVGYFGDGGTVENLPLDLEIKANELLQKKTSRGIHNLMERKRSHYRGGEYLEIERYVSALNTGKRMNWSGEIPLELLKNIDSYEPFIYNYHPIAEQLNYYKCQLRNLYDMDVKVCDNGKILYAVIECDKNIQGVLAARLAKEKPVLIMNRYKGMVVASMRVPDHVDFDAGAFLNEFNDKIPSLIGGGHERAGGVTFKDEDLSRFIDLLNDG